MGEELRPQVKSQPPLRPIGAYAVNRVRSALFQRSQQGGIILRVVFQVRILDQNVLPVSVLHSGADSRSLAAVLRMEQNRYSLRRRLGQQFFSRPVGRT